MKIVESLLSKCRQMKRLDNFAVLGVMTFLIAGAVLWPIFQSPFSADDTFDSFIPMQMRFSGTSYWHTVRTISENWSTTQGRFFPGAVAIGVMSHVAFPGREEYKIVQFCFAILALVSFTYFVKVLTRNAHASLLAVLVVIVSLQFRAQYDGLFQFSLQQPSIMILFFLSATCFILGLRNNQWRYIIASAILYLAVMLVYETTLLFWPLFALAILIERPKRKWSYLLTSAVMPFLVALNLLRLRQLATGTTSGYTSNFSLDPLLTTFAKQSIGTLPLSYSSVRPPNFLQTFPAYIDLSSPKWWVIAACIIIVTTKSLSRLPILDGRVLRCMALLGLLIWLVPAFVVAQTSRWQGELKLGNTYITSFQGVFGVSILLVTACLFVAKHHQVIPKKVVIGLFASFVGFTVLAGSSVLGNNSRVIEQYKPGYLWPRDSFESSIGAGVFGNVPIGSKVLALNPEWWFNAPLVSWFGGPKLATLDSPMNTAEWGDCVSAADTCLDRQGYSYVMNTYGRFPNEPRVVMVGRAEKMTGTDGDIKGIRLNSPRIFIDYPTKSNSLIESESRCLGWGKDRVGNVNGAVDDVDVTVLKFDDSSCLLGFSEKVSFNPYQFTTT
jgi:hypothetical protein